MAHYSGRCGEEEEEEREEIERENLMPTINPEIHVKVTTTPRLQYTTIWMADYVVPCLVESSFVLTITDAVVLQKAQEQL